MKYQVSRSVFTFFFCLLPFTFCFAQEIITGLGCNPVLMRKYTELVNAKKFQLYSITSDTLSLPFLDDFSKESIYPDTTLWLDKEAFINRDYPIAPPTLGVATLDGVGPSGLPYDTLAGGGSFAPADTLTSKPLHLKYLQADSVYFSFFWQAGGRGIYPKIHDSLLVQFKNASMHGDSAWRTQWVHAGFNATLTDTTFHLVMIRVDTSFLKEGFQFRFRNYACLSGNVDHWHIDYVYLNKRPLGIGDTIFSDVAFVYNSSSLLKNYTAMPWEQYQPSEMKTNLNFFIRNNDIVPKNTSFTDTIYNATLTPVSSYTLNAGNVQPYATNGYCNYPPFSNPPISTTPSGYTFPLLTAPTSFQLECVMQTNANDMDKWNDTLRYRQKLYDYYSYDDGTVEGGYGLWVSPGLPGGEIAYKFTLNNPDTIVAVQMLFNWIVDNQRYHNFRIILWRNDGPNGTPGTIILKDSLVSPQYQYIYHPTGWGNLTNDFYTYNLTSSKYLTGTFYVGLVQLYTPIDHFDLLNIGVDMNINSNTSKLYWNDDGSWGSWNQSVMPGSLMIRPVFRNTAALTSVTNTENPSNQIKIFPNPNNGKFNVQMSKFENIKMEIYNVFGECIDKQIFKSANEQIDLSNVSDGIYFLRMTSEQGATYSQKFIISK